MSALLQFAGNGREGRLEGSLDIASVAAVWAQLLPALRSAALLELDLGGLHGIDAAGLQLLLMAKLEASRLGHRLDLHGHHPAVVTQIERFNLAAQLGDPLVLPAGATA